MNLRRWARNTVSGGASASAPSAADSHTVRRWRAHTCCPCAPHNSHTPAAKVTRHSALVHCVHCVHCRHSGHCRLCRRHSNRSRSPNQSATVSAPESAPLPLGHTMAARPRRVASVCRPQQWPSSADSDAQRLARPQRASPAALPFAPCHIGRPVLRARPVRGKLFPPTVFGLGTGPPVAVALQPLHWPPLFASGTRSVERAAAHDHRHYHRLKSADDFPIDNSRRPSLQGRVERSGRVGATLAPPDRRA